MIFLNYLHSLRMNGHSFQQLVLLYQVFLILTLLLTDVPFTNGQFSSYGAFLLLECSGVTSDSSLYLFIHLIHSLYKSQKPNHAILLLRMYFFWCFYYCNTHKLTQYRNNSNFHHYIPNLSIVIYFLTSLTVNYLFA